jgi:hypothetical protein
MTCCNRADMVLLQEPMLQTLGGTQSSQGRRSVSADSEAASHAGSRVSTPALGTPRKLSFVRKDVS